MNIEYGPYAVNYMALVVLFFIGGRKITDHKFYPRRARLTQSVAEKVSAFNSATGDSVRYFRLKPVLLALSILTIEIALEFKA